MRLMDIFDDAERYLREDCYCPGEVYAPDGFGYMIYEPTDQFSALGRGLGIAEREDRPEVETETFAGICRNQLLLVTRETEAVDGAHRIIDMLRVPISPNNVQVALHFLSTGEAIGSFQPDEEEMESARRLLRMTGGLVIAD